MNSIRRFLPFALALVIFALALLPASAASSTSGLPNAFWAIQREYNEAKAAGNGAALMRAAQKAYDLFAASENPETVADRWLGNGDVELDILTTYLLEAGKAAEALEDYAEMKRFYSLYLVFVQRQKMTWTPAQRLDFETYMYKSITTKLEAYDVSPVFFTELPPDNPANPHTGAKFEPQNGIYFGMTDPESAACAKSPSAALVYVQFKKEKIESYDRVLRGYSEKGCIIQLAWNLEYKSISLAQAAKETALIEESADYLASLGSPVLLRVAAEMNVWNPPADPGEFKNFFLAVARTMKKRAPNVAMVFVPNDISALGASIMDYYPGDEYVDWVGVSNYYQYYFLGQKNASDFDRSVYGAMEYANPVRKLREIVELFGQKKPIMISEYGVANYYGRLGESTEGWAKGRLMQIQYYVPMFYPEIKAMFYFNTVRDEAQNYALSNSPGLNELYGKLMAENGIYLPLGQTVPEFIYAKLDSSGRLVRADSVIINAYAEAIKDPSLTVTYSIGGRQYAIVSEIPYRAVLDLSGLADGTHDIEVSVKSSSQKKEYAKKTITAKKTGPYVILFDASVKSSRPEPQIPVALPLSLNVMVDGAETVFGAYNINGSNYFKLRDLAYALNGTAKQFDIGWDEAHNAISLIAGRAYASAGGEMADAATSEKTPLFAMVSIYMDKKKLRISAYNIDGSNYFRLRDVMEALDVYVGWDGASGTITLETGRGYAK